ncbi:hypothetical protein [Alteriqipengyuania lutimaris]|uniref:Sulfotransferase family protein n=1 Tax=Alteriqipengyuania lutimaris TaxID=1538146 RepID=A0A395LGG3_9SPHN|nr:hypothetical protein [Alteriqipengyuania lutimaris]MBB3035269.1 hypothetical protein [Alteriqipengyuania lutimaris]RDS75863.1 hypothetical protein DL238_14360 [Alteriqipengyuania lutimaris]
MTDFQSIAADPRWIPHRIDPAAGRLEFLHLTREALSQTGFLADRTGPTQAIALSQLDRSAIAPGPVHFIFHTAFCRSTLLVRALECPGVSAGLSEPGVIGSLVNAGQGGQPLVAPVVDLLARPWGQDEAVFVKPTNHANSLIPALMDSAPQARAILVTNPLPSFLAAVIRKGMMGRRWGRQLYLELMAYAGIDLGMDGREQFAMTDLQAAGLAWFLNQRYFDAIARRYGDRTRVLDGDRFDAERARTLAAVGDFTGVAIDSGKAQEIARGPVFASDAKTGADFAEKARADASATQSAVVEDEIAKVGEWIGIIAQQAGLQVPVRQTLF